MCNRIICRNATLVPAPRRVDFPAFIGGLRLPSTNNGTTVKVFACTVVWSFSEGITTASRIMHLTDWTVLQQISSCVRGTKYRRNRASEKHCRHACQRSTSAEILPSLCRTVPTASRRRPGKVSEELPGGTEFRRHVQANLRIVLMQHGKRQPRLGPAYCTSCSVEQ